MKTAEERSKNLFRFFGWQGGTIHQVAKETGVDINTLLYGEPTESYLNSKYSHGACASETCALKFRLELVDQAKGNKDFWIGVACSRPID